MEEKVYDHLEDIIEILREKNKLKKCLEAENLEIEEFNSEVKNYLDQIRVEKQKRLNYLNDLKMNNFQNLKQINRKIKEDIELQKLKQPQEQKEENDLSASKILLILIILVAIGYFFIKSVISLHTIT